VPQVMPNSVSNVRIFWWRTSCSIWRKKENDVIGGPRAPGPRLGSRVARSAGPSVKN
jgi:hypothetical protein